MNPYFENVVMPDRQFKIKTFISSSFEHVIEVHPHWHEEVEILYVIKGYAMQQVNNKFFAIQEGDMIIIGSGQLHSTYSYKGSCCDILVLMFDVKSLFAHHNISLHTPSSSFSSLALFHNPLKTAGIHEKELLNCMLEIRDELENKKKAYIFIIKSILYKMAGILERNEFYEISRVDEAKMQMTRQVLEKSFDLIARCYTEKIDLKKASSVSNLSVPHFCRLFKKTTGMTFNDYLIFYRVNVAEKMLCSTRKISDIAMECGFGSLTSFIRNFKKYKSCTPSAFRSLSFEKECETSLNI